LGEVQPEVVDLLDFLRCSELNDVVLTGGAPRDVLLGKPPRDFDFTFLVQILEKEKTLTTDPPDSRNWNRIMGDRVAPRLAVVARALDDLTNKSGAPIKAEEPQIELQYSGPLETGSSYGILYAADDRQNYRTTAFFSVNMLGLLPNGEWIGSSEGFEDLRNRQVRLVPDNGTIPPDKAFRFIYLNLRHGLEPTRQFRQTLDRLKQRAARNPKELVRELKAYNKSIQKKLSYLFDHLEPARILAALDQVGLEIPLLRMEGPGSDRLRAVAPL